MPKNLKRTNRNKKINERVDLNLALKKNNRRSCIGQVGRNSDPHGAIGGWVRCGLRLNGLNSVEYYDDVADKWTLSTPMIAKRYEHSAVAFREKIYVLGGINSEDGYLRTAEVFDTELEQFSAIKSMNVPRLVFAAAISEHKLYCFGGPDCKSVESLDLYNGEWKNEEDIAQYGPTTAVAVYDN